MNNEKNSLIPVAFVHAVKDNANSHDIYGLSVTIPTEADLLNCDLFMIPSATNHLQHGTVAINRKTKEICYVSKPKDSDICGTDLIKLAIEKGGRWLNCYEGFLSMLYSEVGFKTVSYTPFNLSCAPKGWDVERQGRPNVVFMVLDAPCLAPILSLDYVFCERVAMAIADM